MRTKIKKIPIVVFVVVVCSGTVGGGGGVANFRWTVRTVGIGSGSVTTSIGSAGGTTNGGGGAAAASEKLHFFGIAKVFYYFMRKYSFLACVNFYGPTRGSVTSVKIIAV